MYMRQYSLVHISFSQPPYKFGFDCLYFSEKWDKRRASISFSYTLILTFCVSHLFVIICVCIYIWVTICSMQWELAFVFPQSFEFLLSEFEFLFDSKPIQTSPIPFERISKGFTFVHAIIFTLSSSLSHSLSLSPFYLHYSDALSLPVK